jgi:hypothetical protein
MKLKLIYDTFYSICNFQQLNFVIYLARLSKNPKLVILWVVSTRFYYKRN